MASRASPFEFEHYPIEILKANTIGLVVSLEIAKKNKARVTLHIDKRSLWQSAGCADARELLWQRQLGRPEGML